MEHRATRHPSFFACMPRTAFVYLLQCADNTLYTGWTYDVELRLATHQAGRGARYTRTRRPVKLIYHERVPSRIAAMKRELEIKRLPRAKKLAMAKQTKRKE